MEREPEVAAGQPQDGLGLALLNALISRKQAIHSGKYLQSGVDLSPGWTFTFVY